MKLMKKTQQECETTLTSQFSTLFLVRFRVGVRVVMSGLELLGDLRFFVSNYLHASPPSFIGPNCYWPLSLIL